jgi:YcxB-like protein
MSEGESIHIDLHVEASDFQRVLVWYRWKMLFIVFAVISFLTTPMAFFLTRKSVPMTVSVVTVTTVFLLFSFYQGIRRQAKNGAAKAETTHVVFDTEGLRSTALTYSNETKWPRFEKIVETDSDFVFFPQKNLFYPIPKRFFETEDQIEKLKVLLRAYVGDKAKLKG